MPGEWSVTTLDQLGAIVTGKTPPSGHADFFGGDIPFVTPTDFDGRRIIETTGRCLTGRGADSVSARISSCAVMVSCIGSDMGKAAIAGRESVTNQQINSIVVAPPNDPLFVYYNLSSRKVELQNAAGGSAQPILNKSAFGKIDIVLPPPNEQHAIAHVLGTLDDKIELNQRMSETLEASARALFKSWFVDFDPVRAKAEGKEPRLPKAVADLFPARFADSELGEIPEGWRVVAFGDVAEHVRDQLNPSDTPDATFSHFSIPAFDEGRRPTRDLGNAILSQKFRVPPNAVLLSKLNPDIDRVWLVDVGPAERSVCSTEFLVLKARPPYGRAFVYCLGRSSAFRRQLEGLVTGTSRSHQRAQADSVLGLSIVGCQSAVLNAFERMVGSLLDRTLWCRRESGTLASLRNAMLPKLITGQMRVSDSERFVLRPGQMPTEIG